MHTTENLWDFFFCHLASPHGVNKMIIFVLVFKRKDNSFVSMMDCIYDVVDRVMTYHIWIKLILNN